MGIQRSGRIGKPENLTGDLDLFTVYTTVALAEGAFVVDTATHNFAVLTEAAAVQPVLATLTSEEVDLSVAANRTKYGLGTSFNAANTTVYTYRFSIEHTGALGHGTVEAADASVPYSLAARIQGLELPTGAVFETADAATKNVSITVYENI